MADKEKYLNDTKDFPDSTPVTFDGQKTTLGELRKGSGTSFASPASVGSASACPKCKSTSTVNVKDGKACNACGHRWDGAR
jgi:hypothetical protein